MTPLPKYVWAFVRVGGLICLIWGAFVFVDIAKTALDIQILPHNETIAFRLMLTSLLIYALLLAVPFVPGAEIGMSLMAVFGPASAPLVYVATLAGLSLAYVLGALMPPELTCRGLNKIGLSRAAKLIAKAHESPEDMLSNLQRPMLKRLAKHRYLALMVLVNMPGNVVFGGGGGLSMVAGLSGAFRPLGFILAMAIAVAPIPLAIYLFGTNT